MVLYKIYSQEYRIRYLAHPFSSAVLFQLTCLVFTFLPPLFIGYFTSGFYYKELTYSEQPNAVFNGQYFLSIDTVSSSIFTSFESPFNNYFLTEYVPSVLTAATTLDQNGDGTNDQFTIQLTTVISPTTISGGTLNLWIIFQYALKQYPLVKMETLAIIPLKIPPNLDANSKVSVYGQLRFQQREPIISLNNDTTIQGSIMDYGTYSLIPRLNDILNKYYSRNYYTTFDQDFVQWSSSSGNNQQFTIKVVVNSGLQTVRYVPTFWKEFRWSWIQYFSILVPNFYLVNKIKEFVFSARLVRTCIKQA